MATNDAEPWNFAAWMRSACAQIEARSAERHVEHAAKAAVEAEAHGFSWPVKYKHPRCPAGSCFESDSDWGPCPAGTCTTPGPLSEEQIDSLRRLFYSSPKRNPQPEHKPRRLQHSGRTVDPLPGVLYGGHLRASSGACQRCGSIGQRDVDHCHKHLVVRGLICRGCNSMTEDNIGDNWRCSCSWCAWDIWLAQELS